MDIVAHGLWVGIGLAAARRKRDIPRGAMLATIAAAMAPDLVQLLPVLFAAVSRPDGMAVLYAYIAALPGFEPALPPWAAVLTHHLHCVMHSAVVAGVLTAVVWLGEQLQLPQVVGGAILLLGLAVVSGLVTLPGPLRTSRRG